MMFVQVDRHSWPFFFPLKRILNFEEEDDMFTNADLVYNGSILHLENVRFHECLTYVTNLSVFTVVLMSEMN